MKSAELINTKISDRLIRQDNRNQILLQQLADEENVSRAGPDLFTDDLYVWSLLLVNKESFKESDR